ncbi:MAG: uracil-DNA glycosylase [Campylobacterota bacterium]|nr:uracil-DNA glycosylase [Campylobacterota bacterium]
MLQELIDKTSWSKHLKGEVSKEYFKVLDEFVSSEYKKKTIFPKKDDIFNALKLTPLENVKVVVLGQDPYHGENQSMGLAFSVKKSTPHPPSLRNIFKELQDDSTCKAIPSSDLTPWATQGVLLLNAVLSVVSSTPNSHANRGWEIFTDSLIKLINEKKDSVVFILWGAYAQKKSKLIDESRHLILKSSHPSPLSAYRGFFGSKPFSKTNSYLSKNSSTPINWC